MKFAAPALLLALAATAAAADEIASFDAFVSQFGKSYATSQAERRARAAFESNLDFIRRHNAEYETGLHTYEVGVNEFTDLMLAEFAAKHLNRAHFAAAERERDEQPTVWLAPPPPPVEAIDWRNVSGKAYVTPIKNQKQCGSCWAFSAVGSTESAWALAGHNLTSLSEQQLVSCDKKKDHGCNGGLMNNAFKYIISNGGLTSEQDFPYASGKGKVPKCDAAKEHNISAVITKFVNVPAKNLSQMMAALSHQPISIAVEADQQGFQMYKRGIFSGKCGTRLDHGVLLVGMGTDYNISSGNSTNGTDYFNIKNSWGKSFGEQGYIRFKRKDGNGQCGMNMQASYPIASTGPPPPPPAPTPPPPTPPPTPPPPTPPPTPPTPPPPTPPPTPKPPAPTPVKCTVTDTVGCYQDIKWNGKHGVRLLNRTSVRSKSQMSQTFCAAKCFNMRLEMESDSDGLSQSDSIHDSISSSSSSSSSKSKSKSKSANNASPSTVSSSYVLAGVEDGFQCYCATDFNPHYGPPVEAPMAQCQNRSHPCTAPPHKAECGGPGRIVVFHYECQPSSSSSSSSSSASVSSQRIEKEPQQQPVSPPTVTAPPATVPTTTLANGVRMPQVLLGMGVWCNSPTQCPPPAKPCRPCYNDSAALADLTLALSVGFTGVDTAAGYGNQVGVGQAVYRWEHGGDDHDGHKQNKQVFVQSKIPACHATQTIADCANQTRAHFEQGIAELNLGRPIDSMLLHSPPTNGTKGDACMGEKLCGLAQAQWRVLEQLYLHHRRTENGDKEEAAGDGGAGSDGGGGVRVRAIGVSNYCSRCIECLKQNATVLPHINQVQYHTGMPGADPTGLISYLQRQQPPIVPQAYSPLGNYATHSLLSANLTAEVGKRQSPPRSAAQVALRWVVQNNVTLAVAADRKDYLAEDIDIFDWSIGAEDKRQLDQAPIAPEDPTRGSCTPV